MRTATRRGSRRRLQRLALAGVAVLTMVLPRYAPALVLDDRGEMRLGMRAYTAARIGTEKMGGEDDPLTFPKSGAGNLRQHRYFLELKLDHDVRRLAKTGWGLARLFGWLDPNTLKYSLQYRGEGEGIYDYGSDDFSHQYRKLEAVRLNVPNTIGTPFQNIARLSPILPKEYIKERVDKLRRIARQRHRFFLGYFDLEKGPVFVRVGRQILAWGETDVFRLLDNINPLDDSFGGFFIPLDERRLPLDMVRTSYHFGSVGPLNDTFLEGFAALGNRVATFPGIQPGSPWEPGGLGFPNPSVRTFADIPDKTDIRGGARLVFNHADVTYTLAHYYTYLDVPGVQFRLPGAVQLPGENVPSNSARFRNEILAVQRFPRVPITGASLTFPLESFYSVVRSEAAYFQGEPMNRQGRGNSADTLCPSPFCPDGAAGVRRLRQQNNTEGGLDPFIYPRFLDVTRQRPLWGKVLQRDTFNYALGLDVNRFIHWLNPHQTFFITTQFFYKHVFDSPGDLVLPVPFRSISVDKTFPIIGTQGRIGIGCKVKGGRTVPCLLRPRLLHLDDDRFLHTLLVTTSYYGGRIIPSYGMFYDWQGAFVFQPGVTYVRDPFRFITDYTRIQAAPTGQFGAVRDRDNVRFQIEFVF
jgi:hypothetical protein